VKAVDAGFHRSQWLSLLDDAEKFAASLDAAREWELRIRVERCVSWARHALEADERGVDDSDSSLIFLWIAFNALYSRWTPTSERRTSERVQLDQFLTQMNELDRGGRIRTFFELESGPGKSVRAILRDQGLDDRFWEAGRPTARPAPNEELAAREIRKALAGHSKDVCRKVVLRIYVARCQLIHGGARSNSLLNRDGVHSCERFLRGLLSCCLRVILEDGRDSKWDQVPYPPPPTEMVNRGSLRTTRRSKGIDAKTNAPRSMKRESRR
jgi:hypothetical protein